MGEGWEDWVVMQGQKEPVSKPPVDGAGRVKRACKRCLQYKEGKHVCVDGRLESGEVAAELRPNPAVKMVGTINPSPGVAEAFEKMEATHVPGLADLKTPPMSYPTEPVVVRFPADVTMSDGEHQEAPIVTTSAPCSSVDMTPPPRRKWDTPHDKQTNTHTEAMKLDKRTAREKAAFPRPCRCRGEHRLWRRSPSPRL